MHSSAGILFCSESDPCPVLARWSLTPTPEQFRLHQQLATCTLTPDATTLRQAASWLGILQARNQVDPQFDPQDLAATLDEKSALVHRLAYRHVPEIAAELETTASPL